MRRNVKRMLRLSLLMTVAGLSASCAAAVGSCDTLALREYPLAEQIAVADEMEAAPDAARWPAWMTHYLQLRASVRACKGQQ